MNFIEEVLQRYYRTKTFVRGAVWDVIWYLGGVNKVTIGERGGKYYFIPPENTDTVTDILPFEIIQAKHAEKERPPIQINSLHDLKRFYLELEDKLTS